MSYYQNKIISIQAYNLPEAKTFQKLTNFFHRDIWLDYKLLFFLQIPVTKSSFIFLQGVSKKRNTFDLEYLKDSFIKLIVLLKYYRVLP